MGLNTSCGIQILLIHSCGVWLFCFTIVMLQTGENPNLCFSKTSDLQLYSTSWPRTTILLLNLFYFPIERTHWAKKTSDSQLRKNIKFIPQLGKQNRPRKVLLHSWGNRRDLEKFYHTVEKTEGIKKSSIAQLGWQNRPRKVSIVQLRKQKGSRKVLLHNSDNRIDQEKFLSYSWENRRDLEKFYCTTRITE